jgi:hypothetical protein
MLDRVVGLMGVTLGQGMHDPRRRHLYGRAGEYRNKRTIEYRVPEVLIGAHPAIFNLTWDLGRGAFWIGVKGFDFLFDAEDDEVRAAINEYDVPLALKILKRNEGFLKKLLTYSYGGPEHIHRHTFATIYEGIHHAVAKPTDLIGNWRLDAKWVNETDEDPETHRTGHLPGVTWSSTVKILETGNKV